MNIYIFYYFYFMFGFAFQFVFFLFNNCDLGAQNKSEVAGVYL